MWWVWCPFWLSGCFPSDAVLLLLLLFAATRSSAADDEVAEWPIHRVAAWLEPELSAVVFYCRCCVLICFVLCSTCVYTFCSWHTTVVSAPVWLAHTSLATTPLLCVCACYIRRSVGTHAAQATSRHTSSQLNFIHNCRPKILAIFQARGKVARCTSHGCDAPIAHACAHTLKCNNVESCKCLEN